MPLTTIVEEYIIAVLKHAVAETLEDGAVVATSPELPGVITYGNDVHECARQMYPLIEGTVRLWLENGYQVPVVDGIDLNSERGQVLASYHSHPPSNQVEDTTYQDEAALEAAFEAHRKPA